MSTAVATGPRDIRDRGHPLRFGLVTPPMWRSWDELLDLWRRAERAGYDMAFVTDHFQSDWRGDAGPTLEAWTMLGALAREVPRIRIGTYVTGITHRPIAVLVKQALTVDHLSGGRLIVGLGAAWNEPEHRAFGIPFPPARERVDAVEDTLELLAAVERDGRVDLVGRTVRLAGAPFVPGAVQRHLPILIGSQRPRMVALAGRYADHIDLSDADAATIERIGSQVIAASIAAGRAADAVTWMHELIARDDVAEALEARVAALAPLGVSTFLVNVWPRSDRRLVDRAARVFEGLRRRWGP